MLFSSTGLFMDWKLQTDISMKKVIKCAKSRKEMLGEGVEIEDICFYVF